MPVFSILQAVAGRVGATDSEPQPDAGDSDGDEDALVGESVLPHDIDRVVEVLGYQRRRWVIGDLADHGETPLHALADRRATHVYGPGYTSTERKREYVSLYQNHLPTLADAGVVTYDEDGRHLVAPGPHFDGYLEALATLDYLCRVGGDDDAE